MLSKICLTATALIFFSASIMADDLSSKSREGEVKGEAAVAVADGTTEETIVKSTPVESRQNPAAPNSSDEDLAELQKTEKGPAPTPLLGEYAGELSGGRTLAFQIRPVGGGDFDGLAYEGGLPGAGAIVDTATRLVGHTAGPIMVLSGADYAIFVDGKSARVISVEGALLGTLTRVNRSSPTLGASPPDGAVILFDGTGTDQFTKAEMTASGNLKQGANVYPLVQDFDLHLEFKLPLMPDADSQARGNSGIYIHSRYECQILDSFATLPVFNGCGSIYRTKSPDVNMCLPPEVWQTYDIRFTAARWGADGKKIRNARVTSWLNGVKIQDDINLKTKTGNGKPEGPEILPTLFQDHKDQVRFRNIWMIDRGLSARIEFPQLTAN